MAEVAEGTVSPEGPVVPIPDEPVEAVVVEDHKPDEDVAREVLAGHWGRGNHRKARLEAAGYDVGSVEAEVSKLLNL